MENGKICDDGQKRRNQSGSEDVREHVQSSKNGTGATVRRKRDATRVQGMTCKNEAYWSQMQKNEGERRDQTVLENICTSSMHAWLSASREWVSPREKVTTTLARYLSGKTYEDVLCRCFRVCPLYEKNFRTDPRRGLLGSILSVAGPSLSGLAFHWRRLMEFSSVSEARAWNRRLVGTPAFGSVSVSVPLLLPFSDYADQPDSDNPDAL